MTTKAKADRAKKLISSAAFKEFYQEVIDAQVAVFSNPIAKPDEISEAHAMIRALRKIVDQAGKSQMAHKMAERKAAKS